MNSAATFVAIRSIDAYQRFISPYKGFRCAHHACTGGMTCSNYGRFALREFGLLAALPRMRERLIQCSQYATDPRKGKINEDDPGPLSIRGCGPGKAKDRHEAARDDWFSLFVLDLACNSCLFLPF
jgi:putative component of membrane protein insertase Oxa1/YidC/SpoIIIJ protein YidD